MPHNAIELPTIVVNLKTYERGSGTDALELALQCEHVAGETAANVAVAVQNPDVHRIAEKVEIPVIAQHIDPDGHGAHTGSDIAATLQYNGADGVLINHSEDQTALERIEDAVTQAHDSDLQTIVCIDVPEMAEEVSAFNPDFVAYEPPELIGGSVSVTDADPELVKTAVNRASPPLLCGAGVKDADDVRQALELGTRGVLIASGVVKAKHPKQALETLVTGLQD